MILCGGSAFPGRATADCRSATNPIALRTCTLEAVNVELSVIVPCTCSHTIISIIIVYYSINYCQENTIKILSNSSSAPIVVKVLSHNFICAH